MFGTHPRSAIRHAVQLASLLAIITCIGCSVEASNGLSDEQAAMGAEFGRVWINKGASLYTLEIDDTHPSGRLIHSRTIEEGGFVALIGYTDADAIQGSCGGFKRGLAAIELADEEPSPTFFVDKQQLLGVGLTQHDAIGIGIRTESVLNTATVDTCGEVSPTSVSVTNVALLRPVVDTFGRTLPLYLDVTTVTPLRLIPATEDIASLDVCISDAFWDSEYGSELASLLEFGILSNLPPHTASDECSLEGQSGHFVRITQGDANRLLGTTAYENLEARVLMGDVAAVGSGGGGRALGRVALVVGITALAALRIGALALPKINLSSPEVAPAVAFTQGVNTVAEAGVQAYQEQMSPKGYARYLCVAVCGEHFSSSPLDGNTTVIRTKEVTSVDALRTQLQGTFPQNEQALFALGAANQIDPAKANAINNLQRAYSAAAQGAACINPVVPMCVFITY